MKKKNPYAKYQKKKYCRYPFTPEPLGYCWGYAIAIDKGETLDKIHFGCKDCEYFINPFLEKRELAKIKQMKRLKK